MDQTETALLEALDDMLRGDGVRLMLDEIVTRVEHKLANDTGAAMAWESVPLDFFGVQLPPSIRSSWVFILRANMATGAERHPNSLQRMMSYRGCGDFPTRNSLNDEWESHRLVSDSLVSIQQRWISIPPNVWHEAVVGKSNWIVVSFHTVPEHELIEERPDTENAAVMCQRRYADMTAANE